MPASRLSPEGSSRQAMTQTGAGVTRGKRKLSEVFASVSSLSYKLDYGTCAIYWWRPTWSSAEGQAGENSDHFQFKLSEEAR
jgi:hypothetical protein